MTATATAQSVWIPKDYTQIVENEFGIVFYTVFGKKPHAIAYKKTKGNAAGKCKWHFSFPTVERLNDKSAEWLDGLVKAREFRAEQKAAGLLEAQKLAETVKIGDIFVCSWGYDQTNVDFYQVTVKSGRSVTVREIAGTMTKDETGNSMAGYCVAVKDSFVGEPEKHLLNGYGFRLTSYSSARLWEGKPMYKSWYA